MLYEFKKVYEEKKLKTGSFLFNSWQFLAIPNNTFTILTNTKLYLPNKSGISWYCLA